MENTINKLIEMFLEIKNKELNQSLRKGTTGIGYTFETLIGKKEDSNYLPDFEGIEIKTKLGYTKAPLTLFCLTPSKAEEPSIKFLLNKFGYPNKQTDFKSLRCNAYNNFNNIIANRFIFKLKVDRKDNKLRLIIKNLYFDTLDDSIYWNLDKIKERLYTKLSYLAYIKGYPYKKDGQTFYKYTSLEIFELKDFNIFLELIEQDKIFITFNIGVHTTEDRYGQINDRGTAFRISIDTIDKLFRKIYWKSKGSRGKIKTTQCAVLIK